MTTAGPWSVKGIDPKAREIAKDLARRSGLTLGEWLNQMITDTSEEPGPPPQDRIDPRIDPWAEPPPALARGPEGGLGGSMGGGSGFGAESFRSRLQSVGRAAEAAELSRVTRALTELSQRIEAAEHRSTLAISGIDQQVMGVLSRIEDGERDASATAARFDGALDEVRAAQEKIAARLAKGDAEDAPRVEAMKSLEAALARMAAQIYEGESRARAQGAEAREGLSSLSERVEKAEAAAAQAAGAADAKAFEAALARLTDRLDAAEAKTSAAVAALETSFASLDARTKNGGEDVDARFSRLAADLQAKVEGDRAGMADGLRAAAADPKLDRMEAALRDLSGQVGEAEKRSAAAIDRMGHEIIRIASNMHGRMERVEASGSELVDRVGGEMAKFADVMESRARRADDMQAEALERLGGEIAKIAEKLSERIGASETRTAKAMTDLGEQLEGSADRLNARYDHALADVAERLRRSEEKTRAWLERSSPAAEAAPAPSHASSAFTPDEGPTEELDPFAHIGVGPPAPAGAAEPPPYDPFATLEAELASRAAPTPRDPFPTAPAPTEAAVEHPASPAFEPQEPEASHAFDPFAPPPSSLRASEAAAREEAMFAPLDLAPTTFSPPPASLADPAPADPFLDDPRRSSTRDLISQARAAAREASEARNRRGRPTEAPTLAAPAPSAPEAGLSPLPKAATAKPASGFSLSLPRRRKRDAGTLRTLAYASGVAVTITMAAVGAANIASHAGEASDGAGEAPTAAPPPAPVQTAEAAPAAGAGSTLAMAVSGEGSAPAPHVEASPPATTPDATLSTDAKPAAAPPSLDEARTIYSTAVRRLEGGDAGGLPDLRRAATLGLPQAQFHLANLYEDGKAGLPKDPVQARAWMARAASGGDSKAMFNLGLDFANGEGGEKDDRSAVAWFRRAADLGLRDAQFNLAVMNQNGRGGPKSAAEAYKWFTIAAAAGDPGARASADALRPELAPDVLAAAERSAAAYRAQTGQAAVAPRTVASAG